MTELHCPFCLWYRRQEPIKSAPQFDYIGALRELHDHLGMKHSNEWANLQFLFGQFELLTRADETEH